MDAKSVAQRLAVAGCIMPDAEADELVSSAVDDASLERAVQRRERGEPLAWIVGTTTFNGRRIRIDPGVYVPRPQTEALARRGAELLPPDGRAADLCTGSGAIAFHLMHEVSSARVVATDIDAIAATCAHNNGVRVVQSSLGGGFRHDAFDVVTSVAPYVPTADIALLADDVRRYEPRRSLDGGADGLDVVRAIVADAARLLRSGGWFLTEVGGRQDVLLESALAVNGFAAAESLFDEEGDLRGIVVRRR